MPIENLVWYSTTEKNAWEARKADFAAAGEDTLELTGEEFQEVDGFGACINELGWEALLKLEEGEREKLMEELFRPGSGCSFNFCRLPIGASDYALQWYSHSEQDGDYGMEKFSIDRDRLYLLPYIKKAQQYNPDLKFFASPWSPPTWMKTSKVYNHGMLIWTKEMLEAYALYFLRFVQAYEAEGVTISQIHIQNEPMSDQKFPSCIWTGEQFREFIRDYIGPLFKEKKIKTEIWLGTLNGPEVDERYLHTKYDDYANLVLSDPEARKYIRGISYQWAGKYGLQQTYMSWPEMKYMQSENECGDGTNTWEYARYIFNLFRHYFTNGVNSYIYWNAALQPGGRSTWGWRQNSMVTVEPSAKKVIFNPEFYVMKHFSHFVEKGARRLGIKGHWTGNCVAFKNLKGEIVIIAGNGLNRERNFTFKGQGIEFSVMLEPFSFNTLVVKPAE